MGKHLPKLKIRKVLRYFMYSTFTINSIPKDQRKLYLIDCLCLLSLPGTTFYILAIYNSTVHHFKNKKQYNKPVKQYECSYLVVLYFNIP